MDDSNLGSRALSAGVTVGQSKGMVRRRNVISGTFRIAKSKKTHTLRPKTVDDIVRDVAQAAADFVQILDTSSGSVETYEVLVGAIPFAKVSAVSRQLDGVLLENAGADRVAIGIKRDNSRFSFVISEAKDATVHPVGGAESDGLSAVAGAEEDNSVEIQTTAGPISYAPPINLLSDTLSSNGVGAILSAYGKETRTLAGAKRKANLLLGLPVGRQYLYPVFQLDRTRKEIIPVVAHANTLLDADDDPWGALSWWFTGITQLKGKSPHAKLMENELTVDDVDMLFAVEQLGMG
ncbi:hypothetical protein HQO38_14995 [Rhodococcus fascians]|uniref:hypothetical protein n=1 Tax=Rhodococcoides fascians TaxID=1828 RepID=UPI001961ACA3|nr:hypothetical protein [Rhodococcus fascians]MBM7244188.1 hypothetical protein [Rhodococcus fascians]MBY3810455.1 hypothetical protein [Rhodococcus fascians]MBY3841922.1 hypothetical protein [Rhodococcus fascians]MBY3844373.1 hypothetical protein [Rhodococcus fascians]MBY3850319.1 hypothetical protein [Rhodococcus fascians]